MIPPQIEKEILIDAPVEVVWRIVTEPDQMDRWFSEKAEFDVTPGATGRIRMSERMTYNIEVKTVEPNRRFIFRWAEHDDRKLHELNSMLVEFTLHPEAGGTRLRVVESGFDTVDWTDEEKNEYFQGHANGWPRLLERLRDLFA